VRNRRVATERRQSAGDGCMEEIDAVADAAQVDERAPLEGATERAAEADARGEDERGEQHGDRRVGEHELDARRDPVMRECGYAGRTRRRASLDTSRPRCAASATSAPIARLSATASGAACTVSHGAPKWYDAQSRKSGAATISAARSGISRRSGTKSTTQGHT